MNQFNTFYKEFCFSNKRVFKSILALESTKEMKQLIKSSDYNDDNCKRLKLTEYLIKNFTMKNEKKALEFALGRVQSRLESIEYLCSHPLNTHVDI